MCYRIMRQIGGWWFMFVSICMLHEIAQPTWLQLLGIKMAANASARIEDVSKQVLNKIPVATLQVI